MGSGGWSTSDWDAYATKTVHKAKTVKDIYKSDKMRKDLDPKNIPFRESRDSADNPNSTPIIVALDVTGSMHSVLDSMARQGLPTLCEEIYSRKPVTDPHIMCMGVGDVDAGDKAPLQVTQFEADIRIAQQLNSIWLEGHGGGNNYEGYNLPWYFAATRTITDAFVKRNAKGFLFTIGDEETPKGLSPAAIKKVFGDVIPDTMSNETILRAASEKFHIYHIIVEQGSHYRARPDAVNDSWRKLLNQHVLNLSDHTKLAEVIVSVLALHAGEAKESVINSWDGSTSMVVANALKSTDLMVGKSTRGLVTL
jgi:hypothetical protein